MRMATKMKKHLNLKKPKKLLAKANRASQHLTHDVDHYVMKKPYHAMGIVMLAGVCIGFFMHHH